jgi:Gnt-I system high-affinity gluconate transporter
MNLLILFISIGFLLFLMIKLKLNAFLALVITALGTGVLLGMPIEKVIKSVEAGVGATLGQLALVIGCGAMLGELLANSGAIKRITTQLITVFGKENIHWAVLLSAFIIGIPMFFNAAFIILIPIVYSLAITTKMPLVRLAIPLVAALSVTHGYLPPHPGPTAICNIYQADILKVTLYGIIVAIPAVLIGGIWTLRFMKNLNLQIPSFFNIKDAEEDSLYQLPPLSISLLTALSPLLFMAAGSILIFLTENRLLINIGTFLSSPSVALILAVFLATYLLGIKQGKTMSQLSELVGSSIKPIAMILLIIGGGGAFKQVLVDSGVGKQIGDAMMSLPISPLVLAWGITAILRVCLGSSTVAGLTAAGLIAPLADSSGASRELLALATGSGSIFFSNVNDTAFWMFKEYFGTTIGQTFRSWSVMEALVSIVGLIGVLLLSIII